MELNILSAQYTPSLWTSVSILLYASHAACLICNQNLIISLGWLTNINQSCGQHRAVVFVLAFGWISSPQPDCEQYFLS